MENHARSRWHLHRIFRTRLIHITHQWEPVIHMRRPMDAQCIREKPSKTNHGTIFHGICLGDARSKCFWKTSVRIPSHHADQKVRTGWGNIHQYISTIDATSAKEVLNYITSTRTNGTGHGWNGTRLDNWFHTDSFWPQEALTWSDLSNIFKPTSRPLKSTGNTKISIGCCQRETTVPFCSIYIISPKLRVIESYRSSLRTIYEKGT